MLFALASHGWWNMLNAINMMAHLMAHLKK
jgi:hypothetical protein